MIGVGIYRSLLRLYPPCHRELFGEEMVAVFEETQADMSGKSPAMQAAFWAREAAGILAGAMLEHWRALGGDSVGMWFPTRRVTMHTEFRFPKATAVLMAIILGGVMMAIKKGEAISVSVPPSSTPVGPIPDTHSVLVGGIVMLLLAFYALGMIGWAILFAMRRSGVHRLGEMASGTK